MTSSIERAQSVIDRYKKHSDAPGQRDLFTGKTRKPEKTQGKLRWITLHDHNGNGTTHVQIGDDGSIHAGPAALTGRNLNSLNVKTPESPKPQIVKVAARPAVHHGESRHPKRPTHTANLEYMPEGRPVGSTIMDVRDIDVNPEMFQYKISGINKETGTTGELKDNHVFNLDFGGQILVWKDLQTGKTWCINGHHRLELAKKSPHGTGVGDFKGRLPVRYINAQNPKEARALGALANIAEKNGTATDAAKFMRDMNVGLDEFKKRGISPKGSIAQAALDLQNLSPNLFQKLANGQLTEQRGITISKHLPDEEMQDQFFGWLQKHEKETSQFSERKIAEMAKSTARMKPKDSKGPDLFADYFKDFPIEERAEISDHIARTLSGEQKSLRDASSTRRAGMIESEGDNKIDTEANRGRAKRAAISESEFDMRANAAGHPIAEALDNYAERMANESAKKRPGILKEALAHIRNILEESNGRVDSSGEGSSVQPLQGIGERGSDRQSGVRDPESITKMSKRMERAEANMRYCREKYGPQAPFRNWFR